MSSQSTASSLFPAYPPFSSSFPPSPQAVSKHVGLNLTLHNVEDSPPPGNYGPQEDVPATSGSFTSLPLEIIQYITSCLPASSAAAFALCNHYLSQVIGPRYSRRLRAFYKGERQLFLQLLDRDLHDHLYCHPCDQLHLPSPAGMDEWDSRRLVERLRRRRCYQNDFRDRTHDYYPPHFRFGKAQMAMKLHRLDLDINKYRRALANAERRSSYHPNREIFEARVVSDEMIIRTQHWLLLPIRPVVKLSRAAWPYPRVCAHLKSSPYYQDDNLLTELLHCKVEHVNSKQDPCTLCTGLKQCMYCPTEMQIDLKVIEGRGTTLVTMEWPAAGAGISPDDEK
jgi:hypothetical protein